MMRDGRMVANVTAEHLLAAPADSGVRRFMERLENYG